MVPPTACPVRLRRGATPPLNALSSKNLKMSESVGAGLGHAVFDYIEVVLTLNIGGWDHNETRVGQSGFDSFSSWMDSPGPSICHHPKDFLRFSRKSRNGVDQDCIFRLFPRCQTDRSFPGPETDLEGGSPRWARGEGA
jgi:hypothetical protein